LTTIVSLVSQKGKKRERRRKEGREKGRERRRKEGREEGREELLTYREP
jgi:hypothetical protein